MAFIWDGEAGLARYGWGPPGHHARASPFAVGQVGRAAFSILQRDGEPKEAAMYAPNLPEAWEIEEVERRRRVRESEVGERATIPLGPWMDPSGQDRAPAPEKRVVVIQVW
jgi:hypothetical protein